MTHSCLRFSRLLTFFLALPTTFARADQWTTPTPEELNMTAQPQVPGASAVILFREDITEDQMHMHSVYLRLKILTEAGKEYANVRLPYYSEIGGGYTLGEIGGRTIHQDGTIIPFKGKPYEKLIEKGQTAKVMAKVFSLPGVDVGSIVEYRYKTRYDDHVFYAPSWFIQSDLYTRKAHYNWKPTGQTLISNDERGRLSSVIAWTPILPAGAKLTQTRLPPVGEQDGRLILDLNLSDIPPSPHEEFMPPIESLSYRILFYYSSYRTGEEFWRKEGQYWAGKLDKFIGPGPEVSAAAQQLLSTGAPSTTQDQKLRKIYAAIMQLENTDFSREHSNAEEKAAGLNPARNTDDIWTRKRGTGDQVTEVFIAMARSAGMKAYAMAVTRRDRSLFLPTYFNLSQLDDLIAIVNVDGKEQFFDPGQRFCPYSHLAWKHTFVQGLRQTDGGTAIANADGDTYASSNTKRVADLKLDAHGTVAGTVKLTYTGAPALRWRQLALREDSTSLERELRDSLENLLPKSLEITIGSVQKVADYEEPLTVVYNVKGEIGSLTGKRLLLPRDIFVSNSKITFPQEKRELPVYFPYPFTIQDAVRISFPASFSIESIPAADKSDYLKTAVYNIATDQTANSFTVRRNYALASVLYSVAEYPGLRKFYAAFETKDQESVVLKIVSPTAAATATPIAETVSIKAGS